MVFGNPHVFPGGVIEFVAFFPICFSVRVPRVPFFELRISFQVLDGIWDAVLSVIKGGAWEKKGFDDPEL